MPHIASWQDQINKLHELLKQSIDREKKHREIIADFELEADASAALIARQGDILRAVANALHGGPLADGWWSHHDLGEMAQKFYNAVKGVYEICSVTMPDYEADHTANLRRLVFNLTLICRLVEEALKP